MIKTKTLLQIFIVIIFFISSVYGQSWQNYNSANSELQNDTINSVEIGEDGTIWFATNDGLASLKDGVWNSFNTENGLNSKLSFISFLPNNSQNLWVATNFGAVILTANSNSDLTDPQFITKASDQIVSDAVTSFNLDGLLSKWIGTDKGLSVITNSGVYNFTAANGFENGNVSALSVLPDNWVHIATRGGGVSRLKYNGVDGITSASKIENSWSALPSDSVLTIYVTDDTLNWYGTTKGAATFFGENSKSNNWWVYNTFSSGIIDNYVKTIIRDNIGNMWFGTKKGLSKLSADGNSWQSFTEQDGLISNNIFDIDVDINNNLWIATDKGISFLSNIQTSVEEQNNNDYNLYLTNYPNPFNPNTNIEYVISKTSKVKLEVYNNIGKLVEVLVDKKLNSGNYNVRFDSKNLPSGVYFYRLITEQTAITKKMILLK
ncbi:MAG: T9SS type A sorting domain-containing protein [Ignavibacteriae bacterium]|nr:T9SS type A sorting domain-containing protein [Ignavibacteriota bacterium]